MKVLQFNLGVEAAAVTSDHPVEEDPERFWQIWCDKPMIKDLVINEVNASNRLVHKGLRVLNEV